ncbi:hypothetical protein [Nitrosopumilus adriaticus]|uniref:Uncharacterized protein n=1 Tax=Nitrosopumilus adriaticus TaxID=1580092 RepID=A0A0D5C4E6_9ARCH|nr:hypothetical protein [Nitrosopumilus adriaticus]AJW71225.1 exported protein of unknown function [Nitrosopumilus adriaticus]
MRSIIILVLLSTLLIPTTAFAANGYYVETFGKQISHSPTVCVFQPSDSRVDKQTWERWYSDAKNGIISWRGELQGGGNGNWDITVVEVPLEKLDLLKPNVCDISIKYVEKIVVDDGRYVFGIAYVGNGYIEIAYSSFYACDEVYDSELEIFVNSYCLTNNFFRSKQMANTVKHEFGHIIGLGHYRGYDNSVTQSWYDTGIGAPSIMAWIEPNEEWRDISKIDVEKIQEIYGVKGFGEKQNPRTIFNERIIPEPIIQTSDRSSFYLNKNSVATYMISGDVPDKLYKRGMYLDVVVYKPNGVTEHNAVQVSKTLKTFKYPLTLDYSYPAGKYKISLVFDGKEFDKKEIYITKESSKSQNHKFSPDLDGDGVPDSEDKCPKIFGTKDRMGCRAYVPPSKNTMTADSDGDGMVDKYDQCKYQKETRNGYKDSDGCPDTKPNSKSHMPIFSEKQKQTLTQKIDTASVSILKLEEGMDTTWKYLKEADAKYSESQSKHHVQKAWDLYNKLYDQRVKLQKILEDNVSIYLLLESKTKTSSYDHFKEFSSKFSKVSSEISQIGSDMKYISQELEYAEKVSKNQCTWLWC